MYLLSNIPFKLTANNLSSSQLNFHSGFKYLKLVKVDWIVPNIVDNLIFLTMSFNPSFGRRMFVVQLQNWFGLSITSTQGFTPYTFLYFSTSILLNLLH